MLRNIHLWRPTKKINGRMYIIGSNVKCVERNITLQLSWIDTKQNFMDSNPAFWPSCLNLQVNFHEAEINCYVKEYPFMTSNKKNQWENVHNRFWCEMWSVWKETLQCNWVEMTQSKISLIQILPSCQAAKFYRLILMRQK